MRLRSPMEWVVAAAVPRAMPRWPGGRDRGLLADGTRVCRATLSKSAGSFLLACAGRSSANPADAGGQRLLCIAPNSAPGVRGWFASLGRSAPKAQPAFFYPQPGAG